MSIAQVTLENTQNIPIIEILILAIFLVIHAYTRIARHSLASLRNKNPQEEDMEKLKQNKAILWSLENSRAFTYGVEFVTNFIMLVEFLLIQRLSAILIYDSPTGVTLWWSSLIGITITIGMQFLIFDWYFKAIAAKNPEGLLKKTAWMTVAAIFISSPLKAPFIQLRRMINNLTQFKNDEEVNLLDIEVLIHSLGELETALTPAVRKIMGRAMILNELEVSDVLLPRNQVNYLDIYDSTGENLKLAKESGHTRFPVCEGDLDNCIGIVHIKDIFRYKGESDSLDLRKIMRNFTTFTPDDPLDIVLQRLLLLKMHMAIVKDEFGGTIGVITLEQILEELVGEIQDEFDTEEKLIEKIGEDTYRIQGLAPVHDVEEELDIEVENEEVSTFGGLITAEIGRIPNPTEVIAMENMEITIDKVDDRRILSTTARVIRKKGTESDSESEDKAENP